MLSLLQWRHNGRDGISNHQPHHCLLNHLFVCRSKKTPKLHITGLCVGNSLETDEFPAQMASKAENVSIWWFHYVFNILPVLLFSITCVISSYVKYLMLSCSIFLAILFFSLTYVIFILLWQNWDKKVHNPGMKNTFNTLRPEKNEHFEDIILIFFSW